MRRINDQLLQLIRTNLTSIIGHTESLGPLWSKPVERQLKVQPQMLSLSTNLTQLKMLTRYKRIDSKNLRRESNGIKLLYEIEHRITSINDLVWKPLEWEYYGHKSLKMNQAD